MKNKGLIIAILVVLVGIGGYFVWQKKTNTPIENSKGVVKVGVILPLTGDAAVYGKAIKNGIELGLNKNKLVQVVYEDDKGTAKDGLSALNNLLSKDVDIIIGGAMSNVANALLPECTKHKIILLSPTATLPALTEYGSYFFRLWPSDNYDGKIMADFMVNQIKAKDIGVFYINLDYGVGVQKVFKEDVLKEGGHILFSESYKSGQTDFRQQLIKFKNKGVKNLYIPGYYKELSIIFKQIKEINYNVKIYGPQSFKNEKLLELAGEVMNDCIFTYPSYDAKSTSKNIQTFVTKYQERYSETPDIYAVQGYDAITLILHSVLMTEKKDFRKDFLSIDQFDGIGGKFRFLKNGDIEKNLRFMTVKNKRFVDYE